MNRRRKVQCCAMIPLALLLTCGLVCLVFPGFHDYRIALPGGYQLIRPYSGGNCIADPQSRVLIGANVDGYRVVKRLVIGHVSPIHPFVDWPKEATGYFVLDTDTGKMQKDMARADWVSALRARGVRAEPSLKRPNKVFAWLSRIGVR